MKVIQKGFELSKKEYYKTHLKIVNSIFPINITDKEIDILSEFLSIPNEIDNKNVFNSLARKRVVDILGLTKCGMSNHLKNMKNKGFLKKDGEHLIIVPGILPDLNMQGYNFKLKVKDAT